MLAYIAKFLFPYSFLPYLQHMMLVNVRLDISWHKRIIFQGYKLYWSSSFLMTQLKLSWQYGYDCIVENL